jgi:cytochrome c-type biogenesis protein CcmH
LKLVRKIFFAVLLLTTSVSFAADRERVNEISQKLMCTCGGCNTTLGFCPHNVTCPNAVPMKAEIARMLDEGKDEKVILAAFVDKFGPSVLSAPTTSGFNLTAWIMPFVALGIGVMAVIFLAKRFKSRWPKETQAVAIDTTKYQQQVEDELKKYTPED